MLLHKLFSFVFFCFRLIKNVDTVDKMLKNLWIMEISKPFDIISFLKSFPAALRGGFFIARNPQAIAVLLGSVRFY